MAQRHANAQCELKSPRFDLQPCMQASRAECSVDVDVVATWLKALLMGLADAVELTFGKGSSGMGLPGGPTEIPRSLISPFSMS